MTSLLLVLPPDIDARAPLPEPLVQGLAQAGATVLGRATCHTLVQQVGVLAPQQVLVHWPGPAPLQLLCDALQGWSGVPPCAVSVVGAPLAGEQHEALVALGVQAWAPLDALSLPALLARAQARWTREAALRTELDNLRTRMDERKWVDRAKGLLMSARGIGEDEAFGLLRGAAMHANLRLGEVSRSVIEAAQWAEAINRAGQLRMLSQRLVRVAAQLAAGIDAQRARVLRTQSTERVQQTLDHLTALELGPVGVQALGEVQAAWNELAALLGAKPAAQGLAAIDARGEALLSAAEALTDALEASGARRALRIVNICGRQRMRAQRLAKDALLASTLAAGASRDRLLPTMHEFEAALLELERAPLSSPEIRAGLVSARDEWLRLVGGVQALDSPEGRATLVRSSEALVDTFERLTGWYEHSLQVIMS
ncbi:PilJ/NarX-like methyl-accepting chemotaxis transducer [Variovorax sp. 54]|uniref:ANTAR domain-containing protein n=1 Tax=Variovorax sp. 54 TaxID=2035212 RepID=UPI000C1A0551|nr:ANTAR domain-containing protein [Variovorax sp. 54]PIF73940.1 PilJ/NarX-like methyl-accepting chemotaxis transducer [Variovorax sp. 54]